MRRNVYRPGVRVVITAQVEDGTSAEDFAVCGRCYARKKSQVMRRHLCPFGIEQRAAFTSVDVCRMSHLTNYKEKTNECFTISI